MPSLANTLAGNIRLSNSAESVQYPVTRRPSRRGLTTLARHHPHRSSLRRNKEKVKSSAGNGNGNLCCPGCCNSTRNSIAECAPTSNFSNRPRTVSFETNNQLKSYIATTGSNMAMDTTEPVIKSDGTFIIYTSPPDEDIDNSSKTGSATIISTTTLPAGLRLKPPRV